MTPSATESATALATACCAGPNICTAWRASLIVTLLYRIVGGLHMRFGATNASRVVKPSLLLVSPMQYAVSTALPRGPNNKSTCATSLPSPTRDSPTHVPLILGMKKPPLSFAEMTSPSFGSTASGGKRWAVSLDQSWATTTRGSHARLIALAGKRYQLTAAKAPAMKAKSPSESPKCQ